MDTEIQRVITDSGYKTSSTVTAYLYSVFGIRQEDAAKVTRTYAVRDEFEMDFPLTKIFGKRPKYGVISSLKNKRTVAK